jgi:hypothetical protein
MMLQRIKSRVAIVLDSSRRYPKFVYIRVSSWIDLITHILVSALAYMHTSEVIVFCVLFTKNPNSHSLSVSFLRASSNSQEVQPLTPRA